VIQFDPVSDDASNVALYPTFQADFREHQPPLLAIQSQNGSVFMPPGAKVYRRDMPKEDARFLDTCLFSLETHARLIAGAIIELIGPQTVG